MQIEIVTGAIQTQAAQAIVVNLFEGVTLPGGATGAVDAALDGQIRALIADGDFRGKLNEVAVLYPHGKIPARRVILVGLGKREKFGLDAIRQASASAAKKARDVGATHVHTIIHGAGVGGVAPEPAAAAVVEGTLLGLYRFHELKTQLEEVRPDLTTLTLVELDPARRTTLEAGARTGKIVAESTLLARDLINRPANIVTPAYMAETAQRMAAEIGLRCQVLDKATLTALGMNALLSVNRGGGEPAQLVILEHNAGRDDLPTVVLVGKGITFDSGGISLKPGENMHHMKGDMGGAAAVFGALRAAALLDLPLHVVGLTPLTENMPDAHATKPGDVVRSLKGLTIEILNTDAEGRLILADALTYAQNFAPQAIFDIATLTGGRVVALGDHAAAVMGDESLIARLRAAGETTFERVWPLPLFEEYGEQLKSTVADVANIGGRAASSITAGYFLSKFVPDGVPWAHIDIAGLDLIEKDMPYIPKGATGFGVRLLVEVLRGWK
ncbi:MAG TPA: leucyl aminopeptidase [Anaerolineae bacterium]|nr:leucyl aminopeptidase [Anaerolineae bacterium]HQK13052.1 leucyl aminopeptidase [Anaerolineae bacterium]